MAEKLCGLRVHGHPNYPNQLNQNREHNESSQ